MRVALVHDYLNQRGGAERVFAHIARAYPQAPIYTALYDPRAVAGLVDPRRVRTSALQSLPGCRSRFRMLAPFYPMAFEGFDLSGYDLVVSSTTAWAKGVLTRPDAVHVCYINTVSRFAYAYDAYVGGLFGLGGARGPAELLDRAARPVIERLVRWDRLAAQRPTAYIANSRNVARRVERHYGRVARVLPCPVDVNAFYVGAGDGGYALVVSRLLPYKRVDLAIAGCHRASVPLVVVGTGPAEASLRAAAAGTRTHFLGQVDDSFRARLMAEARLVILPGEEDFGLVPIEAAAAGRPTLAYRAGGALETILEHETGELFDEATPESLARGVLETISRAYDPRRLRTHAQEFAPERFVARLKTMVGEACGVAPRDLAAIVG